MAVAPTGAIYKALEFDGVSSRTYGVYITGAAVYNAPKRDVEMIAIPGRNGSFALDKGRFENIEVSYPAGIFADAESDFAEAVSDFRNFLCSRNGYVRLQDEYNPNEYRMAVYKSGLEVDTALLRAGEFEIVFECKPQRWLTSGESAVTVGEWSEWETESGPIVEIEASETDKVKSLSVALEPIQSGSGTPSPDNVRPISGRTECVTRVCGVNVWDEEWELGTYNSSNGQKSDGASNIRCKNFISVVGGATYYIVGDYSVACCYDAEKNYIGIVPWRYGTSARQYYWDMPSNACYVTFCMTVAYGTTYNHDISINYPSTDHDYHAYDGDTYTTDLGRTVYGGTLDVVSGELTVDRVVVDLGELDWIAHSSGNYYVENAISGYIPNRLAICSRYAHVADVTAVVYLTTDGAFALQSIFDGARTRLIIRDTTFEGYTASQVKSALVGSQLCYELSTPQTYQLTPTEVALLKGNNNVWSDGDVTLEYGQDPNVIVNPTLFESKPLLELTGYGDINVNDYTINVVDDLVGDVKIAGVVQSYGKTNYYVNFPEIYINNGDDIDVGSVQDVGLSAAITDANGYNITSASIQNASGYSQLLPSIVDDGSPTAILTVPLTPTMTFHYGTPLTNKETLDLTLTNSNSDTQTYHIEFGVEYDGNKTIRFYNVGLPNDGYFKCEATDPYMDFNGIVIHSTATTFGSPTYIDCEFGEAYTVINGVYNSLNAYVALGSELPSLAPGSNSITFDNTFTNVKVMPRWWKV